MLKMTGKAIIFGATCLISMGVFADCSQFEAEVEAYDSVIPRIDEDGKVRAILMYGESSFLFPKRSLIADARRSAELNARREYPRIEDVKETPTRCHGCGGVLRVVIFAESP